MKSTGIVRKVDELGRVVLPKEIRRNWNIQERDPLEIFIDGDKIILRKFENRKACIITEEVSDENIELAGGKVVVSPAVLKVLVDELEEYVENK
ncbi:AbrB/MazE/SpoVT family DNA-binding domain-containing protein [Cytobacillus horneckiae]|uniref:AbrB/MazE/SpoVT family DNA-binding domain-containing protein n=1 Tax=Cytobacillus horneckiae TaxID=549687 RepID=UPI0034CFCDE0